MSQTIKQSIKKQLNSKNHRKNNNRNQQQLKNQPHQDRLATCLSKTPCKIGTTLLRIKRPSGFGTKEQTTTLPTLSRDEQLLQ
jgi:hypothetical protein